jgi:hypothetical protein
MAYTGDDDFQAHKTAVALTGGGIVFGLVIALNGTPGSFWGGVQIVAGLLLAAGGAYGLVRYWRSV